MKAEKLNLQWVSGMGGNLNNLSTFFKACGAGDKAYVKKMLNNAPNKYKLMEKRESLMRLNALVCVVLGAKFQATSKKSTETVDRMGTLQLLIKEGANIHTKDVAAYSVLFHCFTAFGDVNERRELGLELIKAGLDINEQNRFGCTVLHDNLLNYENLEFLVEHGADPSIKANDGRSPITLVGLLLKPHNIFCKAACIESCKKRQQAKSEGKIFKCYYCGQPGSKKGCANCRLAYYFNRKCQKLHWKCHKKVCQQNEKGKVEVEVKELRDGIHSIINFQTFTNDISREKPEWDKTYEDGIIFKVKVQIQLQISDRFKSPLLVYDKNRTFLRNIELTDKSYDKIVQRIRQDGVIKVKGYFYASISNSSVFKPQVDPMLPPENW